MQRWKQNPEPWKFEVRGMRDHSPNRYKKIGINQLFLYNKLFIKLYCVLPYLVKKKKKIPSHSFPCFLQERGWLKLVLFWLPRSQFLDSEAEGAVKSIKVSDSNETLPSR